MVGRHRLGVVAAALVVLAAGAYAEGAIPIAGATTATPATVAITTANVGRLTLDWTGSAGFGPLQIQTPAVANGLVYVSSTHGLSAFPVLGGTHCAGVPKSCRPDWYAAPGVVLSGPVVANGVIGVTVSGARDTVYAYDAAGIKNCSHASSTLARTCSPLWSAATGGVVRGSPALANGVVYVGSDDRKLYAFSATGTTNCSGTPKRCKPLWTATTHGAIEAAPTVANGTVYVGSDDTSLYAFDAAGKKKCSGTPKVCNALWTGTTGGKIVSSPAFANGYVYVGASDRKLYAFVAAGVVKCPGGKCAPRWNAKIGVSVSSPTVADGVVYIGSDHHTLYAFDALGRKNCGDYSPVCYPLWTATTGGRIRSSPRISNGVVYVGSDDHKVYGYSAVGKHNCSGKVVVCLPLWSSDIGSRVYTSAALANGYVYFGADDAMVHAYTLP